MKKLKVGYLSLVKGSWINDTLEAKRQNALVLLNSLDADIVDCGKLIQSEAEARECVELFKDVDCVIAHSITFSLGAIVPMMARRLNVPVVFWSEPEPPMQGGRLEANSFCLTNMNAYSLWKINQKYSFVYGDCSTALNQLVSQIKVFQCIKDLESTRIGSVGGRVPGFYTSNFDEMAMLETFGVQTEKITLLEVVENARKKLETAKPVSNIENGDVSEDDLQKLNALYEAFIEAAEKYCLNAFAVRCWPEFGDIYGIGVCALLGLLTDNGMPSGCEGDVLGTLAMVIGEKLSGSAPFFCDLISFNEAENTGIGWHCGAAAPSLCKADCNPKFCHHSVMDGGGVKGVTCDFPLKSGPVTFFSLTEKRDSGYRLLMATGEALETEQVLKGNPLEIKFNSDIKEMIETIVENGIKHHYVLVHGDITEELTLFAKLLEIEII
jgi:L-fucose isomerase-like protein